MARYTRTGSVNTVPAINAELEKIENAFNDMVSRKGDVPNTVEANLDMDGNAILNVSTDTSNPNSLVSRADTYIRSEIDNKDANILDQANTYAESVAQGQGISQIRYVQEELPTGPILSGSRWYKPSDSTTYVYYVDGDSAQWVQEPVQSAEGTLRTELAAIESNVLVGGVEAGNLASRITDVKDFGAVGDGITDDTTAIQAAIDSGAGRVLLSSGTYKCNILISTPITVLGVSKDTVTLIPQREDLPVVTMRGQTATADHLGMVISDLTIDCGNTSAIGLQVGSSTVGFDFSNGTIERIDIKNGADKGLDIKSSTNSSFTQLYVQNFDIGMNIDSERNVQLNTYRNCRSRLSRIGAYFASGNRENFINCNFESNREVGIQLLRQLTSGPSHSIFQTCWFENNGPTSGLSPSFASIILDINSSVTTTAPHNIQFNSCNITSKDGAYDVRATRANLVEFNRCSFTEVASGGFSSSKFSFSSAQPRVKLINCGELNKLPTPSVYSSFPALAEDSNSQLTLGFEYFFEFEGEEYTNRQWLTFTPAIIGSTTTGTGTYTQRVGRYRKTGNIVYFSIRLDWSNHTGTGNMDISGLPIPTSASSPLSTCSIYSSGITLDADSILMTRLGTNSTIITLRQTPVGTTTANTVPLDTSGSLILSGFYEV